jgi:hypothetical protein
MMRFEAASAIQQTMTKNRRRYRKKRFLRHLIRSMSVNVVWTLAGTILSDGINKYFLSFLCGFYGLSWELNCHTVDILDMECLQDLM